MNSGHRTGSVNTFKFGPLLRLLNTMFRAKFGRSMLLLLKTLKLHAQDMNPFTLG